MNKTSVCSAVCVVNLVLSWSARAECPLDLPAQLLSDCITVEGSGRGFPHADYAYKDAYAAWLAARIEAVAPAAGGNPDRRHHQLSSD